MRNVCGEFSCFYSHPCIEFEYYSRQAQVRTKGGDRQEEFNW